MGAPCAPHASVGAAGVGGRGRDSALPAVLGLSPLSCPPPPRPCRATPTHSGAVVPAGRRVRCVGRGLLLSRAFATWYDPLPGVRCWCPGLRPHLGGGWCRMCAETVWLWRRGRRGSAQGGTALGQQDMQGTASEMRESLSPAPTWLGPHLAQRLCWERGRWGQSGWLPPPGAIRAVEVFPEPKPWQPALENVGFKQAKTGS